MENEMCAKCESTVKIASDVVCKIAAIAALEVQGVTSMGNNVTAEIMNKIGIKNLSKNVKVDILGGKASVDIAVTVEYGINIQSISQAVQSKVKQAVENMTGLEVREVNVRIAGVSMAHESN